MDHRCCCFKINLGLYFGQHGTSGRMRGGRRQDALKVRNGLVVVCKLVVEKNSKVVSGFVVGGIEFDGLVMEVM